MERGRRLWEELGLPPLKPQTPWFGYSLGEWSDDLEAMAARAVAGDYWVTGEIIANRRRRDVAMNTEVRKAPPE
jgi:4-hydroxy-3-polyprenylbenzoate decarboxylase